MVGISEALKEELICDLPVFRENARKFFDGEISVKDYKGLSGPFGSYAEKGAELPCRPHHASAADLYGGDNSAL